MSPFRTGLAVGLLAAAALATAALVPALRERNRRLTEGWNKQPALVFATDLAEGATVTLEHLSRRPFPEQFLSSSAVPPDDARLIVGRKIGLTVQAGDVVRWAHFTVPIPHDVLRACGEAVLSKVDQATAAARVRSLAEFQKNMGTIRAAAVLPRAAGPAEEEVLVAQADLEAGSTLSSGALARRRVGGAFITPSNIPAKDLDRIAGARLVVPVQRGDPLLWQMLESPDHARTAASCVTQVTQAITKERKQVINAEAAAFIHSREGAP
jgi:Flp pilus assembly protein CpaB